MVKIALFLPFFVLFFSCFAFAQSYDEIVAIEGVCSFEFKLKDAENPSLEKYDSRFWGRGFLAEHKKYSFSENLEYVITAGHIIYCKPNPKRDFLGYDIVSYKLSELFVKYKGVKYQGSVISVVYGAENLGAEDRSLISFFIPRNLKHKHFSLASNNFKYGVGDSIYTLGFLYFGDQGVDESQEWKRVFQQGRILDIDKFYIYVSFMSYPGMSGSPLIIEKKNKLFFWKKRKYVIGIISRSLLAQSGERMPYSASSCVYKDFLK